MKQMTDLGTMFCPGWARTTVPNLAQLFLVLVFAQLCLSKNCTEKNKLPLCCLLAKQERKLSQVARPRCHLEGYQWLPRALCRVLSMLG